MVDKRLLTRAVIAGAVAVLVLIAASNGLQWYWVVTNLCLAFTVLVGRRTIFRAGVRRTADGIECRYIPWYEGPYDIPNPVNGVRSRQVELTYTTPAGTSRTVLLGLQFSVGPAYLSDALLTWQAAEDAAPNEFMDRIDRILRHGAMPDELDAETPWRSDR